MSLLLTFNTANNLSNPSLQPAMATFWPTLQHFFSIKTTAHTHTMETHSMEKVPSMENFSINQTE